MSGDSHDQSREIDAQGSMGLPYLVIKRRDGLRTRTVGPIKAMSVRDAVRKAFDEPPVVGRYDAEVYPLGVTTDGNVEGVIVDTTEAFNDKE